MPISWGAVSFLQGARPFFQRLWAGQRTGHEEGREGPSLGTPGACSVLT